MLDSFDIWTSENLDPMGDMMGHAENCARILNHTRTGISAANRLNKILHTSHHTLNHLDSLLNSESILAFRLISHVLLSGYEIHLAIKNPNSSRRMKAAKIAHQTTIMALSITALVCSSVNIPIVMGLSLHDVAMHSYRFQKDYKELLELQTTLKRYDPTTQPKLHQQAIAAFEKQQAKCNQDIQALMAVVMGLIGIVLILCPPVQVLGAILLLTSTVAGVATHCTKAKPWMQWGERWTQGPRLFDRSTITHDGRKPEKTPADSVELTLMAGL